MIDRQDDEERVELLKCRMCGKHVSPEAITCPECGDRDPVYWRQHRIAFLFVQGSLLYSLGALMSVAATLICSAWLMDIFGLQERLPEKIDHWFWWVFIPVVLVAPWVCWHVSTGRWQDSIHEKRLALRVKDE